MKQNRILTLVVGIVFIVIALFFYRLQTVGVSVNTIPKIQSVIPSRCVPTFADGGGPYYKSNSPYNREKIVPDKNNGEQLVVSGKMLRNDCKTTCT